MKLKLFIFLFAIYAFANAASSWIQKNNFAGMQRYAPVGFSIGNKGYIGTGYDGTTSTYFKDFWEYDPGADAWTQKADFGGNSRNAAVGFSIGNEGYIGTGFYNGTFYNDFWEWEGNTDSLTYNTWTQKADFGGVVRNNAVGFSIGNKGYIGTGNNCTYYNDFWEYTPGNGVMGGTWVAKSAFPGAARQFAFGFSIGTKGYIGSGATTSCSNSGWVVDFYEYDQGSDNWTRKQDFGGPGGWYTNSGFSIKDKGYVVNGIIGSSTAYTNAFWEYDPLTDNWNSLPNFNGSARFAGVTFSIGCQAYIGTGMEPGNLYLNEVWEWSAGLDSNSISGNMTICSGNSATLTAANGTIYLWSTGATDNSITVSPSATTSYTVIVSNGFCTSDTVSKTVTVSPLPTSIVCCNTTIIQGQGTTFNINPGNGSDTYNWAPANGLNCNTCSNPTASPTLLTTYYVTIINSAQCDKTDSLIVTVNKSCGELFVPDAFSPNNDTHNDILYVKINNSSCIQSISFEIFDRWGNMVFESTDLNNGWDGKYKEKEVDNAVFVYELQATLTDRTIISKKGNISLIK